MSNTASASASASSGGLGAFGLLGVVFVVLKLTGVIDWSWWWVTAPFWLPTTVVLACVAVFLLVAFIIEMVKK